MINSNVKCMNDNYEKNPLCNVLVDNNKLSNKKCDKPQYHNKTLK